MQRQFVPEVQKCACGTVVWRQSGPQMAFSVIEVAAEVLGSVLADQRRHVGDT